MIEIFLIGAILFFILFSNGRISGKKFLDENGGLFSLLKEKDYEFLLGAKYGELVVDVEQVFMARVRNAFIITALLLCFTITNMSFITFIGSIGAGVFMFKLPYLKLKSYYKAHLNEVDSLLPYFLKSLEILIEHYTVPVALARSIDDAPEVFRPGLRELVAKIEAGDASIDPYMEFATRYPVRDSMRMMRLLYRLGLGEQEKKHRQLISFSKSVSNLQLKAREQKYKNRLDKMEKQTMVMLVVTGGGSMVLMLVAMVMLLGSML